MSMTSCGCGTSESGPQRSGRTPPRAIAFDSRRTTWLANTTIITHAQIRWMMPALSNPPRMRASVAAHGLSAYRSGRPVSAQPTKVSISPACMTRWGAVKRR